MASVDSGIRSFKVGSVLRWVKPDPRRGYYELRDGENVLASLEWIDPRSLDAGGVAGDRRLLFRRKGLFYRHTEIIDAESGSQFGIFKFHGVDKGELALADGHKFSWKFEGIMNPQWFFTTSSGVELLCFYVPPQKKSPVPGATAVVEVFREMSDKNLILLAVIGWYNLYGILSRRL